MRLLLASPRRRSLASERSKREGGGGGGRETGVDDAPLPCPSCLPSFGFVSGIFGGWYPNGLGSLPFPSHKLFSVPHTAFGHCIQKGGGGLLESSSPSSFPPFKPFSFSLSEGDRKTETTAGFNGAWPWWCTKRVKNNIAPSSPFPTS